MRIKCNEENETRKILESKPIKKLAIVIWFGEEVGYYIYYAAANFSGGRKITCATVNQKVVAFSKNDPLILGGCTVSWLKSWRTRKGSSTSVISDQKHALSSGIRKIP